jgi:methionine biosynthesis protein MetW
MDIGCGQGELLRELQKRGFLRLSGVDVDPNTVESLRNQGFDVFQADLEDQNALAKIPQTEVAVAFELLEHLRCPETLILGLRDRVSKRIVFSVPNTGYFSHRLRLLFGRFPLQWIAHPGEHLRFWTLTDMRFWLIGLGFRNFHVGGYQGVALLNRVFPSWFAKGMIVSIDVSAPPK